MPTKDIDEVKERIEATKEIMRLQDDIDKEEERIRMMECNINMMRLANERRRNKIGELMEKTLTIGKFYEIEYKGKRY